MAWKRPSAIARLRIRFSATSSKPGRGFYLIVVALLTIIAFGGLTWMGQLRGGLGVAGMNQPVYWGLYITNYIFFIGISHAGTLISAILRLTGAEWRRPHNEGGRSHHRSRAHHGLEQYPLAPWTARAVLPCR